MIVLTPFLIITYCVPAIFNMKNPSMQQNEGFLPAFL